MNEHIVFFREFLTEFKSTGSAIPSSPWAAKAMTNSLRRTTRPQNILEVGPGTGPVTVKILEDMIDGDKLTICELNPSFMQALQKKLSKDENFNRHKENITFFQGPVQELPTEEIFDVIICAIPFTNLPVSAVEDIFKKLELCSHRNTHITFFEYIGLRQIGRIASIKERRERLDRVSQFFETLEAKYKKETKRVWLNFTPINVHTLVPSEEAA
ncbi:MAG: methyltransferase domain-containing protein [Deltaproteobacteria bacterium]|nr:methyltransferase domain-containing protein [Deltaproteobacteria bacterium]